MIGAFRAKLALRARVVLACAVLGCAGTETGNPSFEGQLAYDAYSSDARVAALARQDRAAPVSVESVWLVLGDVRFLPDGACAAVSDGVVHATGIGAGDHAAPGHVATALTLQAGRYCGLQLALEVASANELGTAPDALADHSVLIEGALADGSRIRLRSARQQALRLLGEIPISEGEHAVVLGFDVATWLRDVDWQSAERESDGSIEVDATHNRALLDAFEAALPEGTALFRDVRGDGAIDAARRLASGAQ